MHLESHSNVFGRTLNPFNRNLSPGGSSGGEGAIVTFRGAPIGLATDAEGSIRCPTANCGLFGMKASGYRIPLSGCRHVMLGMESYTASVGPVCRTIRDNEHFFKVVLETEPWRLSPELVPVPWRERKAPKKITIGYFVDDGVVRPHPPLLSAMDNLISKLRKLPNMELVEWEPFQHHKGYDIMRKLYFQDGGKQNRDLIASAEEPMLPLSEWVMKEPHTRPLTLQESWDRVAKRDSFRGENAKMKAALHVFTNMV